MKRGVFILFLFQVGSFSYAQDSTVAKLSFREAIQIGLQNNVLLNQQKNQLSYTNVNKTSSLLQLGPQIYAGASAYRVDGNSFNQNEGRVVNGKIDYVNGSVSADLPVFTGLGGINRYKQANNQNEAQLHQVARSTQDAIQAISLQYLTCLLDQELIKIDEQNVST